MWTAVALPWPVGGVSCPTINFCGAAAYSLATTNDGGLTWAGGGPNGSDVRLNGVACKSRRYCVAVGSIFDRGAIDENGLALAQVDRPLIAVACATRCWAVGEGGAILSRA